MDSSKSSRRVGLARALSKLGFCSRSDAFDLIRAGKVRLNGNVHRDPDFPVHMDKDRLEVNGRAVIAESRAYLMLNKPRGVVTTVSDEKNRQTVTSFLPEDIPWVSPVGRLDKASEGLLLLTNDSEWSARVLAPETHLEKNLSCTNCSGCRGCAARIHAPGRQNAGGRFPEGQKRAPGARRQAQHLAGNRLGRG